MKTGHPVIPFDMKGIKSLNLIFWHPINGKWRRLKHEINGNKVIYATDGKIEGMAEIKKSGTINPL